MTESRDGNWKTASFSIMITQFCYDEKQEKNPGVSGIITIVGKFNIKILKMAKLKAPEGNSLIDDIRIQ